MIDGTAARVGRKLARRTLASRNAMPGDIVGELIESQLRARPELDPLYEAMTDDQARLHFGVEEPVHDEHLRRALRFFHAWRVDVLRHRLGDRLGAARMLDVGDTDGLILKHLGKSELGFNLAPAAVRNIESNGVRAELGDGQALPFENGSFDCVLCFETLEHVPSPAALLTELHRVCRSDGRVFVSIPWVPRTFVQPRDPVLQAGYGHMFELCRADFAALLTHLPLAIAWEAVCDLLGPPRRPAHRAYLTAVRRSHIVAGTFRRFQFFELAPVSGSP